MRYLSVCSGVGTDHIAWEGLGWECAGFAEIEPFPSAILAHRYPEVRNYGDFKTIPADIGPIDLLVGGTPCQSFSVAGQRAGLDDPRGNLTLEFARLARRLRARWIVWENVPGVLSSDQGRDFAAILTAFRECGYSVCYRVLDAQHFGVPQRRRRVFVVGYLGDDWRPSAEVLLEQASLRGNSPQGREKGQEVASTLGGGSGSRGWSSDLDRATFIPVEIDASRVNAPVLRKWSEGSGGSAGDEDYNLVSGTWWDAGPLSPTLRSGTHAASHANGGVMPAVAFTPPPDQDVVTFGPKETNPVIGTIASHLRTNNPVGVLVPDPMPFNLAQITSKLNYSQARPGEMVPPLNTVSQMHVALAVRTAQTGANGINVAEDVAHTLDGAQGQAVALSTVVRRLTPRECERLQGLPDDWTLVPYRGKPASDAPRYKAIGNGMAMPVLRWIGQRIEMVERERNK